MCSSSVPPGTFSPQSGQNSGFGFGWIAIGNECFFAVFFFGGTLFSRGFAAFEPLWAFGLSLGSTNPTTSLGRLATGSATTPAGLMIPALMYSSRNDMISTSLRE
ncbi:hypothetical protein JD974_12515 [Chromobacterium haemolyticum]|uniref:Uncharacterized protein n=1 Tax=Chromobacterium haemolyticum TaxID=394935 RepID=A0ABS3GNC6_9NEIS|nr:hypothetical protein [Chromobacterium haemolyticum]MBK0415229.1 hypothetical protein [Chromobacterium haemolyticum]MBO0416556.1 hypothetical protein [Chromobacterium haemolyticum]MBO0499868.1 hypothetical protein [Chromobacterium haemolyticum]